MDRAFILDRITAVKALIVVYEDAITAIASSGVQQYSLDTGQSRQTVTSIDLPRLNRDLDTLYNRLATLEARLYGAASQGRPGW